MFLIEFEENKFIDAERINYVGLVNERVTFSIDGDTEALFYVDKVIERPFLNQLQALNASLTNPEARHNHINNPDTKY
jgi:hypothetical protein|tara:strand:+ start:423 stop:656 length:234 start_codon:yes stop_codon:yes gene_type:complete